MVAVPQLSEKYLCYQLLLFSWEINHDCVINVFVTLNNKIPIYRIGLKEYKFQVFQIFGEFLFGLFNNFLFDFVCNLKPQLSLSA